MELLEQNYLTRFNSEIFLQGVTQTSLYLQDTDRRYQLVSSGYADDTTTVVYKITLDKDYTTTSAPVINRIAIIGHNFKQFVVSSSSVLSSSSGYLLLTSTCQTTTASWTTNSLTSHYLVFSDLTVGDIYIHATKTIVANSEKCISYLAVSKRLVDFTKIPDARNFSLERNLVAVNHELSDGGTRVHVLDEKFSCQIGLQYITETFRNSLKTVYDSHDQFLFVPFPPESSSAVWDEIIFPCQWPGKFNFQFADNAMDTGFSGTIVLAETPV